MLTLLAAAAAGLVCGVLSGFGIGGGSLLMVWMTAVLSMEQRAAQGVNLLYFLPCAACALIFHIKNKQIVWRAVWPAALAGSVCAVGGALLAQNVDAELLRNIPFEDMVFAGENALDLRTLVRDQSAEAAVAAHELGAADAPSRMIGFIPEQTGLVKRTIGFLLFDRETFRKKLRKRMHRSQK